MGLETPVPSQHPGFICVQQGTKMCGKYVSHQPLCLRGREKQVLIGSIQLGVLQWCSDVCSCAYLFPIPKSHKPPGRESTQAQSVVRV